jgi:DedD protein
MAAENGMPEQEDVRKKALLRLAVAGGVTAAALGGLWWLDRSDSPRPVADTAPEPIVAAPPAQVEAPETEAPPTEPEPVDPTEATAATDAASTESEAATSAPANPPLPVDLPPPPRVNKALLPAARPAAAGRPEQTTAGAAPIAPAARPSGSGASVSAAAKAAPAAPAHPVSQPATPPASAGGTSFVVQLGVFSNPDNARELVEKLRKQGVRAHLEARVQLGPYLNRAEAEKARLEMRKLGYNALLSQPYSVQP